MYTNNTPKTGTYSHTLGLKRVSAWVLLVALVLTQQNVQASTWNPTRLVNTESTQAIDDVDGVSNVVLQFGDTLAKTLTYNRTSTRFEFNAGIYAVGNIGASGTLSGAYVHAERTLSSSGTLVFEGAASGSSLYLGTSLAGAGLSSCSNGTTSKLLYDSATGRFSCGTDANSTYTAGQGLTLNSTALSLNGTITGSLVKFATVSGSTVFAKNTLATSGSLIVSGNGTIRGTLSGNIIHAEKILASSGTVLSFGNIITKAALVSSSFGHAFSSGALINELSGFNDMVNIQSGNFGTNGITRLTSPGNLVNIGSIQSGEINARDGGTFLAKTDYAASTQPYALAVGDLNGDGKQDIVAGNNGTTTISVLINTGTGTFRSAVTYTTGSTPQSIAIADFNGDGMMDLAVANQAGPTLSILLNKGAGTFATQVPYTTGTAPFGVATGDVNGDGSPDVAVTNFSSTSVSVFINNGRGAFAAKVDYPTNANPRNVAMGDLNGDGYQDLVVTNNGGSVSVLFNKGNGTFATKVDAASGGLTTFGVVIGDLNGDGKNDVAITNQGSALISVFFNSGTGSLTSRATYATGAGPYAIAIGDLNGDGKPDLITANGNTNTSSVLINNGNGTFAAKVDYVTGASPRAIGIADMNGDGKSDFATANFTDGNVSVLLNNAQTLLYASAGTGGVVGIGTGTPGSTLSVSGSTLINPNGNIRNTRADTALEVVGTISGSQLRLGNMTTSGGIVFNSGSSLRSSAKGFSGQVLVSRATGTPEWKSPTGSLMWYLDGTQVLGAKQGPQVVLPFGFRPTDVSMVITGAPTGAALIVDLKQNGTTIFSTKPQINAAATTGGTNAVLSATILSQSAVMSLDVTQVGSTFAGSGLTVLLNGSRRY